MAFGSPELFRLLGGEVIKIVTECTHLGTHFFPSAQMMKVVIDSRINDIKRNMWIPISLGSRNWYINPLILFSRYWSLVVTKPL